MRQDEVTSRDRDAYRATGDAKILRFVRDVLKVLDQNFCLMFRLNFFFSGNKGLLQISKVI